MPCKTLPPNFNSLRLSVLHQKHVRNKMDGQKNCNK